MASNSVLFPSYNEYEIRRRDPNPSKCVLLVIDIQNRFSEMAIPILPAVNTTIDHCRSVKIPIVYTRHVDNTPTYTMLDEWWGNLLLPGTPDAEFLPGLNIREDEVVLEKNTYSAFRGTKLEEMLREMGVEEVIVTGVMTNMCCETSSREAFVRGFRVFFSADATGTANQDLHQATLKNVAFGFGYLTNCAMLETTFKGNNP